MKSAEVARLFDELKAELVPLIAAVADAATGRRLAPARQLPDRPSARGWSTRRRRADGLRPARAGGIDDAVHPFATSFGSARRPHHDAVGRDVLRRRRCTARCTSAATACTRTGIGPVAAAHAAGPRRVARPARVAEPAVGEHGRAAARPFSGVLAPAAAEPRSRLAVGRPRRSTAPSTRSSPRSSASRPTRPPTTAHRAALRARAGADRGPARGRRPARGLERPLHGATLGVEVPDDAHGVLQDVHWSAGLIGYFPTYALGQPDRRPAVGARARRPPRSRRPDRRAASSSPLREWLREHVHRHGSKFSSRELLAASGRRTDRGRPVRRLPEGQAGRRLRRRAVSATAYQRTRGRR